MKKYILWAIMLCWAVCATATPRLTVVVAVDGMNPDELNALRNFWPVGGLRTLQEEAFQTEVTLPHMIYGGAETAATLLTGVTPQEHGITQNSYFSRTDRKAHSLFEDPEHKGIGTQLSVSPNCILSMTLADRFRRVYGEKSKIYAIGLDPQTTLCMAGHSANACCWLDAAEGRWVTTTYYPEGLPSSADKMNTSGRISEIEQHQWTPRMDILQYMHPTDLEKKKSFGYTGLCSGHAPIVNELEIELALELQKNEHLGEDPLSDLLLIQLTTLSPKVKADHIISAEQEEMYLSVNQNIGFLMEQLNKRIGKQNYQLLVVGLPRYGSDEHTLQQTGLPRREFNLDRAVALMGTYLMAIYGHERWVDGGYGQSIYLNRTLIEQKKLSLETIRRQASDFLLEFSGVQGACSITDLPFIQGNQEASRLRESIQKRTRGDVVFWLEENWVVMNNDREPADFVADRNPAVPVMLWSGAYRNYPDRSAVNALNLQSLLFE